MAQVRCVICKAPGRKVPLVGKAWVAACSRHEKAVSTTTAVGGAALKAGIIAGMEAAKPGSYSSLQKVYWAVREAFTADPTE